MSTNNLENKLLTTGTTTFTRSGATFSHAEIGDEVLFRLATRPASTGFVAPEPGPGLLLGAGLLALALRGRRLAWAGAGRAPRASLGV